jgi:hypothetical protein
MEVGWTTLGMAHGNVPLLCSLLLCIAFAFRLLRILVVDPRVNVCVHTYANPSACAKRSK